MRVLPVSVRPLPGETTDGYLTRLANANELPIGELVRYVARKSGSPRAAITSPRLVTAIEQAGGLESEHFARDRYAFRLFTRCDHTYWLSTRCPKCVVIDRPRTACLTCAEGQRTETFARGGAFCIRHSIWHFGATFRFINDAHALRRAEQIMAGHLWDRGITMFTGEFGLALELLRVSMSEQPDGATTALDSLYAAAVELTYVLTDTEVIDTLVTPQRRMDRQIEGLIGLTVGAGHGVRTRLLEATATDIIHTHRRALVDAIFMPVRPAAVFDLARFGKATVEATYRHNAVLLRHIDEVRPRIERRSKWPRGATDGKTVSRRLRPGWAEDVYPVTDVRRDPERDHVGLTRAKVRDVARDQ